jgi:hypothetical protein
MIVFDRDTEWRSKRVEHPRQRISCSALTLQVCCRLSAFARHIGYMSLERAFLAYFQAQAPSFMRFTVSRPSTASAY